MAEKSYFFAGGGTGGHIYPAIAVAEQIIEKQPGAKIHFFCSSREIDSQILSKTNFEFTPLPARSFSPRPGKLFGFISNFLAAYKIAKNILAGEDSPQLLGVGGFVSAPAVLAAKRLNVPISILTVDIVPGKANKLLARFAKRLFVQFDDTVKHFGDMKSKVAVVGCPLRKSFLCPDAVSAKVKLGLDAKKKILLITGASSGSANINRAVCGLLGRLAEFAGDWQIVHLAGHNAAAEVAASYEGAKIDFKVVDYFDEMADLLAAADLVIGRSGAVSVAEYAAAGAAAICIPYPYHRDMHQKLNAEQLRLAGAAVIVDDVPDNAGALWAELEKLMADDDLRERMQKAAKIIAKPDAAEIIAESLI